MHRKMAVALMLVCVGCGGVRPADDSLPVDEATSADPGELSKVPPAVTTKCCARTKEGPPPGKDAVAPGAGMAGVAAATGTDRASGAFGSGPAGAIRVSELPEDVRGPALKYLDPLRSLAEALAKHCASSEPAEESPDVEEPTLPVAHGVFKKDRDVLQLRARCEPADGPGLSFRPLRKVERGGAPDETISLADCPTTTSGRSTTCDATVELPSGSVAEPRSFELTITHRGDGGTRVLMGLSARRAGK